MQLANIYKYAPGLSDIAYDVEEGMMRSQRNSAKGELEDLRSFLFKWALESVCFFLYDQRIGCLSGW